MTEKNSVNARVLFVDDEANILNSLRRLLRRMRGEWEMEFVAGGKEALAELDRKPYDAIVSDMRMPQMDGAALLQQVRQRHPGMARIILSGYATQEALLRAVGPAHNFLSKPCDKDTLVANVRRSLRVRKELASPELRRLVLQVDSLPSLPMSYWNLVNALSEADSSVECIGETVSKDMGLSSKLLQFVNSSYFDLPEKLSDPVEAVRVLGVGTVKALVMGSELFASNESEHIAALHAHAQSVVVVARSIARDIASVPEDEACLAAMLHRAGSMVLAASDGDAYHEAQARSEGLPTQRAEQEVFGTWYGEIGGRLLDLWGIPDPVVEAVVFHREPQTAESGEVCVLSVLHVASAIVDRFKTGSGSLDREYLERVGLLNRVPEWEERFRAALRAAA